MNGDSLAKRYANPGFPLLKGLIMGAGRFCSAAETWLKPPGQVSGETQSNSFPIVARDHQVPIREMDTIQPI